MSENDCTFLQFSIVKLLSCNSSFAKDRDVILELAIVKSFRFFKFPIQCLSPILKSSIYSFSILLQENKESFRLSP